MHRIDRALLVAVAALVGLSPIVLGWTAVTSGTVGGFRLPAEWLSSRVPFGDHVVPGLVLLVVIGLAAAAARAASSPVRPAVALARVARRHPASGRPRDQEGGPTWR